MALSSAEKDRIRILLGYSSMWRYVNYRLEGAMATADNDDDVQAQIRVYLAGVDAVEAKIATASINSAGVQRVDDVVFFKNVQLQEIRSIGRMYIGRISIALGVPIYSDYYSAGAGYRGDSFSDGGGGLAGGGGGGIIPLG